MFFFLSFYYTIYEDYGIIRCSIRFWQNLRNYKHCSKSLFLKNIPYIVDINGTRLLRFINQIHLILLLKNYSYYRFSRKTSHFISLCYCLPRRDKIHRTCTDFKIHHDISTRCNYSGDRRFQCCDDLNFLSAVFKRTPSYLMGWLGEEEKGHDRSNIARYNRFLVDQSCSLRVWLRIDDNGNDNRCSTRMFAPPFGTNGKGETNRRMGANKSGKFARPPFFFFFFSFLLRFFSS